MKSKTSRGLILRLAKAIDVSQKGESRIPNDIQDHPVAMEKIRRCAQFISALCLLLAFALGCAPTYAPKAPMSATASWDGSAQNSGFIAFDAAGNGILTPHSKDRYVGLVTIYGARFNPPLEPTAGLTLTATNTFIIDGQHLAYFATMNRWKKEGK